MLLDNRTLSFWLKGLLGSRLQMAIMRVSKAFKRICSKVWDPSKIYSLRNDVAISLALMEMNFPPSFFNIMKHLVDELDIGGPIAIKWMYHIER
jgi:hypothetical protein